MTLIKHVPGILILFLCFSSCGSSKSADNFTSIEEVRDRVINRIIIQATPETIADLDDTFIQNFITPDERKAFAENHWRFTVDRPAIVSVMRDKNQQTTPFWLPESDFVNTKQTVKNRNYEYEVWQKQVPAGEIRLGINGFDLHRPVYFVTIGPIENGDMPDITNIYPDRWRRKKMEKRAFTYNDWTELTIEEFPEEIEGHTLFTTIRGRAREAAIINSFRTTEYPSSNQPDQVVLTWSDNPATSQSIQWRTDTSLTEAHVNYWETDSDESDSRTASASSIPIRDSYIYNEPVVNHWEVNISELTPQTKYNYQIICGNEKSAVYTFKTAPDKAVPFKFIFIGDTHNSAIVEQVMEKAYDDCPDAAFVVHSGDHVNTGLFRNQWDEYFYYMRNVLPYVSFVPALGNHDSQDGLPPDLFKQLFMLPGDERNYTFAYSNARFFVLDSTGDTDSIAQWLEQELEKTTEPWRIAITHFPPYWKDDSYPKIREKWSSLFGKYGVSLVLTGHVHQYFRSYPIFEDEPRKSDEKGTIYVTSVAVGSREMEESSVKFNKLHVNTGALYQIIEIDNNQIYFVSKDLSGGIIDEFRISKYTP